MSPPVELLNNATLPRAVLPWPVVRFASVSVPNPTLLLSASSKTLTPEVILLTVVFIVAISVSFDVIAAALVAISVSFDVIAAALVAMSYR